MNRREEGRGIGDGLAASPTIQQFPTTCDARIYPVFILRVRLFDDATQHNGQFVWATAWSALSTHLDVGEEGRSWEPRSFIVVNNRCEENASMTIQVFVDGLQVDEQFRRSDYASA